MRNNDDPITTTEFKRLIFELWEHSPQTKIRFRVIGHMWDRNFSQIVHITASDTIFVEAGNEMTSVRMNEVSEFELESKYQDFQPYNHYKVKFP